MSRRLALLHLLEEYSPSANEENDHARMLVLAHESGDVLSRYHFDPGHFTVSGFVVSEGSSDLLLVFHERLGKWLQPGGHIEPADADIEAAARREVAEETGVTDFDRVGEGLFDIDVHVIPGGRGEPSHEHHDLRFLFETGTEASPGDGIGDIAWVPLDEVADLTADRSVLRAVAGIQVSG